MECAEPGCPRGISHQPLLLCDAGSVRSHPLTMARFGDWLMLFQSVLPVPYYGMRYLLRQELTV
jgi:hypothetical protein